MFERIETSYRCPQVELVVQYPDEAAAISLDNAIVGTPDYIAKGKLRKQYCLTRKDSRGIDVPVIWLFNPIAAASVPRFLNEFGYPVCNHDTPQSCWGEGKIPEQWRALKRAHDKEVKGRNKRSSVPLTLTAEQRAARKQVHKKYEKIYTELCTLPISDTVYSVIAAMKAIELPPLPTTSFSKLCGEYVSAGDEFSIRLAMYVDEAGNRYTSLDDLLRAKANDEERVVRTKEEAITLAKAVEAEGYVRYNAEDETVYVISVE